jgi:hypothetical protein
MGKQILGFILFIAGLWVGYQCKGGRQPEDDLFRACAVLMAVSGYFLFFIGIKCEIIEAIKNKDSKEIKENKE